MGKYKMTGQPIKETNCMSAETATTTASSDKARRGPKPKLDTRENLIRAGTRLLHETGYSATGIKDIVDAAKVPKGSFYNHFPSKEAFGAEALDFYFGRGLPVMREMLGDEGVPPLDRLKIYFDQRIQRFAASGFVRGCLMGNLSLEVADHSALIRERLTSHFQVWAQLFEDCIAQAQAAGSVRNNLPAALLAQYLLDSWEGALIRMRVEKSVAPLERFVAVTFKSLLI